MFIICVCLCEMVLRIDRSWMRRRKITWLIWDQGLLQWSAPGSVLLLRPACLPLWLRFAPPHPSHSPPDWLFWVSLVHYLDIKWEALLFVLMLEYHCFADVGSDSVSGTLSSLTTCQPQDDFDSFAQTRTGIIPERKKYETNVVHVINSLSFIIE